MRVIFAGGGTGGHLFPGIALAQELVSSNKSAKEEVLFLCTDREFDRKQLERYQFNFSILASPRLPNWKNPISLAKFLLRMYKTFGQTKKYFKAFKPQIVVGLGGYGSFSSVRIAKGMSLPFAQLEQNVLPGKITRGYCREAQSVFSQWSGTAHYIPKCGQFEQTGSPIRQELLDCLKLSKAEARKQLGLTKEYVLLVIGGSQGAGAINKLLMANMGLFKSQAHRLSIIHLTGPNGYDEVKNSYQQAGIESAVFHFSDNMGVIYAASDFAISRAGGIAIAEMAIFGLPMILIPLPTAADNHQYFNAIEVEQNGAGRLLAQGEAGPKIASSLVIFLAELKPLSQKARAFGRKDAAKIIAEKLIKLANP